MRVVVRGAVALLRGAWAVCLFTRVWVRREGSGFLIGGVGGGGGGLKVSQGQICSDSSRIFWLTYRTKLLTKGA